MRLPKRGSEKNRFGGVINIKFPCQLYPFKQNKKVHIYLNDKSNKCNQNDKVPSEHRHKLDPITRIITRSKYAYIHTMLKISKSKI